jgi:thiol:disulfide interchange protein DsbA
VTVYGQTSDKFFENYRILPTIIPNDKIYYFIWYGAPQTRSLSNDINDSLSSNSRNKLQLLPIAYREELRMHSLMFYSFEELNRKDMHQKAINAIAFEGKRLLDLNEVLEWIESHGINKQRFQSLLESNSINSKAAAANQLGNAYRIDSVPTFVIYGRFVTSFGITGTKERTFDVVNSLASNQNVNPTFRNQPIESNNSVSTSTQQSQNTIENAKQKCSDLGFKSGTEGFGKCVLQLSK